MSEIEHEHPDHDYSKGLPYCEFLLKAKRELEKRVERMNEYGKRADDLLDLIRSLRTDDDQEAVTAEWPMTDSDVRRAVARRWEHSDGSPLTAEEEAGKERELSAALTDLRYNRALHDELEDINAGVKWHRDKFAEFQRGVNQAARLQAKHVADSGGARDANRASRRSRGKGRGR